MNSCRRNATSCAISSIPYPIPLSLFSACTSRGASARHRSGAERCPAFKRQGYRWRDVNAGDMLDILGYVGFWHMAARYWRTGLGEMYRSLYKQAMVKELQKLVPVVESRDLARAGAGVRAQALDRHGKLVEDFHIVQESRMITCSTRVSGGDRLPEYRRRRGGHGGAMARAPRVRITWRARLADVRERL